MMLGYLRAVGFGVYFQHLIVGHDPEALVFLFLSARRYLWLVH